MNYIQAAKFFEKMAHGTTGGHTRCRRNNCGCLISNEDFDTYKSTNKECPVCKHPYYDHDLFLWLLTTLKISLILK